MPVTTVLHDPCRDEGVISPWTQTRDSASRRRRRAVRASSSPSHSQSSSPLATTEPGRILGSESVIFTKPFSELVTSSDDGAR